MSEELQEKFNQVIRSAIPIAGVYMGLAVVSVSPTQLVMKCPIDSNRNDKGTAFAGSIASALALSGWCLVSEWAWSLGFLQSRIAIVSANNRFLAPVTEDFYAIASFPFDIGFAMESVMTKGRGTIPVQVEIRHRESDAQVLAMADGLYHVSLQK